jgi:hypothetical protein
MAAEASTAASPTLEAPPMEALPTDAPPRPPTQEALAAPVAASPEPRTPAEEPAASDAKGKTAKKADKPKKGEKKGRASKAAEPAGDGPSIAAHPRAARAVARAKGWGGLAGFVLGGYLSLPTNTLAEAGLRALLAGLACYVAAWAGAVFLWRRLVMLEIKGREQQLLTAAKERADAAPPRSAAPAAPERPRARAS